MADVALAVIAAAGLGYSAYAGERQQAAAKKGLRLQEEAQNEAQTAAIRDARVADEEENRARQKTPDLNVLLADQMTPRSGPTSIDADRLLLGRPGLLGY